MKSQRELHTFSSGIILESGEVLSSFDLMVDTYGELNSDKSNAILVCHAFSGSHHAAGKNDDGKSGWWDELIGPNKAIVFKLEAIDKCIKPESFPIKRLLFFI